MSSLCWVIQWAQCQYKRGRQSESVSKDMMAILRVGCHEGKSHAKVCRQLWKLGKPGNEDRKVFLCSRQEMVLCSWQGEGFSVQDRKGFSVQDRKWSSVQDREKSSLFKTGRRVLCLWQGEGFSAHASTRSDRHFVTLNVAEWDLFLDFCLPELCYKTVVWLWSE